MKRKREKAMTRRTEGAFGKPDLLPELWQRIFDEVAKTGQVFRMILCLVCKRWLALAKGGFSKKGINHLDNLMILCVYEGYERLLRLTREWGGRNYDIALIFAGHVGCERTCRILRDWGARDYVRMVYAAASAGRTCICCMGLKWISRVPFTGFPSDIARTAIRRASVKGHTETCRGVIESYFGDRTRRWRLLIGALIMDGAIVGDQKESALLANEWHALRPEHMLNTAAAQNRPNICELAKELGALNFDDMLGEATISGLEMICRLAKEWGATDFARMRRLAKAFSRPDLHALALEWGAPVEDSRATYATDDPFTSGDEMIE